MGLDMFLTRKTYVKNWDHHKPEHRHTITIIGPEALNIDTAKIVYIEEEVGYWRKANQIHDWFVKNVQGGVDECQISYVSRELLTDLYNTCNEVLATAEMIQGGTEEVGVVTDGKYENVEQPHMVIKDPSTAQRLLPTQEGFFFGGTDYDSWYIENLKLTVEILKPILARKTDSASYYYQSSW